MNKLLNKTLLYYCSFAVVLLVVVTPITYWVMQSLQLEDVNESIALRKNEFMQRSQWNNLSPEEIEAWNRFNRDIKLLPDTVTAPMETIVEQVFYDTLDVEWEPYHVWYQRVPVAEGEAILMVRKDLIEAEDIFTGAATVILSTLVALLIGFLILTRIIAARLWRPFYQSLEVLRGFDISEGQHPELASSRIAEFAELKAVLDGLISHSISRFRKEQEFTQNASHELQTPLAVFRSKLDLLLQNESLTEDQAKLVHELYDAANRLLRINKNLLLLAKMENTAYERTEVIDMAALVRETLPYFEEQAQEKSLTIDQQLYETTTVSGNRGLVEVLVNNLLMNAIRHNRAGGAIQIELTQTSLRISNTGATEALDAEHVFERFAKTSRHAHSAGLGLAISRKIARLHEWELSYQFEEQQHVFLLHF